MKNIHPYLVQIGIAIATVIAYNYVTMQYNKSKTVAPATTTAAK